LSPVNYAHSDAIQLLRENTSKVTLFLLHKYCERTREREREREREKYVVREEKNHNDVLLEIVVNFLKANII
jgi:hypothetical protein